MGIDRIRIILIAVLVFMAALTILLYAFPLRIQKPSCCVIDQNALAESSFLQTYGFQNNTNLANFYQVQNKTNELVFDCNYGMEPVNTSMPAFQALENTSIYSVYSSFVHDVGLLTLCGYNSSLPGCSSVKQNLYNVSSKFMNATMVEQMFVSTRSIIYEVHSFVENSSFANSSFFYPVFNDTAIINSTADNKSAMLRSLIDLVPIPQYVFDYPNGTVEVDPLYLDVPFRYHSFVYPMKKACTPNTIFNLVSDISGFGSAAYDSIYSGLNASIFNICINSSMNNCAGTPSNKSGFSFYEQG